MSLPAEDTPWLPIALRRKPQLLSLTPEVLYHHHIPQTTATWRCPMSTTLNFFIPSSHPYSPTEHSCNSPFRGIAGLPWGSCCLADKPQRLEAPRAPPQHAEGCWTQAGLKLHQRKRWVSGSAPPSSPSILPAHAVPPRPRCPAHAPH